MQARGPGFLRGLRRRRGLAKRPAAIESEKNFVMTNYFVGMYKSVQTPIQRSVRSEPALHHRHRHAA